MFLNTFQNKQPGANVPNLSFLSLLTGLSLSIYGCAESKDEGDPNTDSDGDGFAADVDCDDDDATVFPGAVDEASDEQCMKDEDGDGYGDDSPPEGFDAGSDCDDSSAASQPGIAYRELDPSPCMTDADADGFGSSDGPGSPGNDHYDDDPMRNILPSEGHWTYGEATIVSNNCPDPDESSPVEEAGFTLANTGDQLFSITADGSTDATPCELSANGYTCPTSTVQETISEQGVDIDIGISTVAGGIFLSDGSLEATYSLTFTCEDVDNIFFSCSDIGELPCTVEFKVPASLDAQ